MGVVPGRSTWSLDRTSTMSIDKQTGLVFAAAVIAGMAAIWNYHVNANHSGLLGAVLSTVAWSAIAGAFYFGRPTQRARIDLIIVSFFQALALAVAGDISLMGVAGAMCAALARGIRAV